MVSTSLANVFHRDVAQTDRGLTLGFNQSQSWNSDDGNSLLYPILTVQQLMAFEVCIERTFLRSILTVQESACLSQS